MSLIKKIRGYLGQQLLENTAGYRVIRSSGKTGPWVDEGESLALVPIGIQEVQFPVAVMSSDSIMAQVQVSVVFTFTEGADQYFNFAYDVAESRHVGNFADIAKKMAMSVLAPQLTKFCASTPIAEMLKETALTVSSDDDAVCMGMKINSVQLVVRPNDQNVIACLGSSRIEELLREANKARTVTRMQAVAEAAELRTAEHEEAMTAAAEAELLIAEQAKNQLAEANAKVAADEVLAKQKADETTAMVLAFRGDPMAFAMTEIARSGGDLTINTDFLAAMRGLK